MWGGGWRGLRVSQHVCFTVISLLCGPALPSPTEHYTHASVTSLSWVGESQASLWWLPWTADSQLGGAPAPSLSWKASGPEAREVCEFNSGEVTAGQTELALFLWCVVSMLLESHCTGDRVCVHMCLCVSAITRFSLPHYVFLWSRERSSCLRASMTAI